MRSLRFFCDIPETWTQWKQRREHRLLLKRAGRCNMKPVAFSLRFSIVVGS